MIKILDFCLEFLPDCVVDHLYVALKASLGEAGLDVCQVVPHNVHRHHPPPHAGHWQGVCTNIAPKVQEHRLWVQGHGLHHLGHQVRLPSLAHGQPGGHIDILLRRLHTKCDWNYVFLKFGIQ